MTALATSHRPVSAHRPVSRTSHKAKIRLDAATMVDFGLDGLLRWAHINKLRSATIEYTNNTKFTGRWIYAPASPGKRESLTLLNVAGNIEAVSLAGVWTDTNNIRPQISAIIGHK